MAEALHRSEEEQSSLPIQERKDDHARSTPLNCILLMQSPGSAVNACTTVSQPSCLKMMMMMMITNDNEEEQEEEEDGVKVMNR